MDLYIKYLILVEQADTFFAFDCEMYIAFRFYALVKEILTDAVGNTLQLEAEIDGDTLEVSCNY